jgi:hypothetical protein
MAERTVKSAPCGYSQNATVAIGITRTPFKEFNECDGLCATLFAVTLLAAPPRAHAEQYRLIGVGTNSCGALEQEARLERLRNSQGVMTAPVRRGLPLSG